MPRIIVGTTGSVAAVRVPDLCLTLIAAGHHVEVVATEPSLHFYSPAELPPGTPLHRDDDEWPVALYARGDEVLHIELRRRADVLVLAPLDANTLGKLALGLCDNLLTCLFRAWDPARPVVLAPAMNTLMWDKPVTARHLGRIWSDVTGREPPADWSLATAEAHFAREAPTVVLVPPQSKRLACGDVGDGAMADVAVVAEAVRAWAERSSPAA